MELEPSTNEPPVTESNEANEPIDVDELNEPIDANEANETNDTNGATGANETDGWVEPRRIFPVSRIRKIMKCDADVRLIQSDVPVLLAKACEFFITDLVQYSWKESNRDRLSKVDICSAIQKVDKFDFLIDIVPRDEGSKKKNLPL